MNVTVSDLAVGMLSHEYPGLQRIGFKEAVRQYLRGYFTARAHEVAEESERNGEPLFTDGWTIDKSVEGSVEDATRDMQFIPDAFRILPAENEIQIFEVEDTHPLKVHKIAMLTSVWTELGDAGITFRVFTCDRYANQVAELDLARYEPMILMAQATDDKSWLTG